MSWEKDPLWAKARLFFQRAFANSSDDAIFGLWCSLGLELLARAAIASVSPTLLAEPDRDQKSLLHALGRGSERSPRKSIGAAQVFALCSELFPEFTRDDLTVSLALVNRRNEELHSGTVAFKEYPPNYWLAGFYRACRALTNALGESLVSLLGEDEGTAAADTLEGDRNDTRQRVLDRIGSFKAVFLARPQSEQDDAHSESEEAIRLLVYSGHHKATCPACGCAGSVQGRAFGLEYVESLEDEVLVRQSVSPSKFSCPACNLKLDGYAELEAAGLAGLYTRRTSYTPEEYYGLIHPDDLPELAEEYLRKNMREYDNE